MWQVNKSEKKYWDRHFKRVIAETEKRLEGEQHSMTNEELRRRLARIQGRLMKMVGDLESCKLMLIQERVK